VGRGFQEKPGFDLQSIESKASVLHLTALESKPAKSMAAGELGQTSFKENIIDQEQSSDTKNLSAWPQMPTTFYALSAESEETIHCQTPHEE
jgi:hypothetical protein